MIEGVANTVEAFDQWLLRAQPGQRFVYVTGASSLDGNKPAAAIRRAVAHRAAIGTIAVVQEKNGDGTYEYLAERITPRTREWLARVSLATRVPPREETQHAMDQARRRAEKLFQTTFR